MEQGSASNGTITDIDGKFTLSLPSNSVLAVKYVGFSTKNIPVNNQNAIQIVMEEDSEILEEVVVVAYGTQKKISSTAAVSSMKTKDVAQKPVINISNSLAGRMAGVIAKQGSGEPGADGSDLRIRGVATLGNQSPLVVVDGVPRDFSRIDPNMIEDITILKDAAAVLIVNGASPDEETLEKGKEEDVPLLGTPLSAFEVTGKIYSLLLQE